MAVHFWATRRGVLRSIGFGSILLLAACPKGCQRESEPGTGTATVSFPLIPTDITCIVINVVGSPDGGTTADGGSTFTEGFAVAPQGNTTFDLSGLPLGSDTFSAQAYNSTQASVCPPAAGTPATDVSNPVVAQVVASPPVRVTLVMGGTTGEGVVTVDFPTPAGQITEFPANALTIATGSDGNLWFTSSTGVGQIGRFTFDGGVTEFVVPTVNASLHAIAAGPDGNLWFTEATNIGRIFVSDGGIAEYPIPTMTSLPSGIAAGPDGNLWFTETFANKIGRITPSGNVTEFPVSGSPIGIATGSDGNLWFTDNNGQIDRISPSGVVTPFSVSPSAPQEIAQGSDGALWFTEVNAATGDKVGRITTSGVITEFALPSPHGQPANIAAGPDGNLWFTERSANNVGRILVTDGGVTEFPLPTPNSQPRGITAGPDGNVWFTEQAANNIGRITTL